MCGFLVNISFDDLSKAKVDKISRSLYKRGPDKSGHITYNTSSGRKVDMIHTRLEILGIGDNGSQPMQNDNYILVFNGEIYNYKDLISSLGFNYEDSGDTKLLLDHITKYGIDYTLKVIRGIYSIVILDKKNQILHAVRDPFGTKPLYIYKKDDKLCLASNISSIKISSENKKIGNLTKLGENFFLLFGFTYISSEITTDINEIDPSKLLTIDINKFNLDFKSKDFAPSINFSRSVWEKEIYDTFNSDVPISILLSGGVDSTFLSSLTEKIKSKNKITTFTLKNSSGSNFEDVQNAKKIAKQLNIKNSEINVDQASIDNQIKSFISEMEYPTDDGLNIYIATNSIYKNDIKVCLTGLGGDEFFGGYSSSNNSFKRALFRKSFFFKFIPFFNEYLLKFGYGGYLKLNNIDTSTIEGYLFSKAFIFKNMPKNLVDKSIKSFTRFINSRLPENFKNKFSKNERISLLDLYSYCIPQLVKDSDTFGMANSVEVRPALLVESLLGNILDNKANKFFIKNKNDLKSKINKNISKHINKSKKGFTIDIDDFMKLNIEKISSLILKYKENHRYKYIIDEFKFSSNNKKFSSRKKYFIWRLYILSYWKKINN
tara:strand:- start:3630 stop:5438 length:1809 start_codon:yes stop_codon:yes gene_type:complete